MKNYLFESSAKVIADPGLNNGTIRKFWKSFCLGDGELIFSAGEKNTFVMGDILVK